MKEYDIVEVIVEKEKYAKEGVHKGMQGVILDPRNIDGQWLVFFEDDPYGTAIKEEDLKLIYDSQPVEIKIVVEIKNENYASVGIHKGMQGIIRDVSTIDKKFTVYFDGGKTVLIPRDDFVVISDN